ncbi:hypothetical protein MMC25_006678 [Agyrium rufum]|nr:hypothetical protein [Agyrium rufum]
MPTSPRQRTTASSMKPEDFTQPFLDFISANPTVFHTVAYFSSLLETHGFSKLSERDLWADKLEKGGKYFFERNGSGLIAFSVGGNYKAGNGAAIIASHIDALTGKLKPVSTKPTRAGFQQLGVAPYAGALNQTWFDRDLGVGGRVFVKDAETGKIETKLVQLGWPIARIPTLAPHFGIPAEGQANKETRMIPVIGLDNSDIFGAKVEDQWKPSLLGGAGTFAATQPPGLVKAIAGEMGVKDLGSIVNWELEMFDTQSAQLLGLGKEMISAARIDDKLCSFSALNALIASSIEGDDSGIIKVVGLFDDEEVGSLLRQGARSNFLPSTIERIVEAFGGSKAGPGLLAQTYANGFLISADVTHSVNPNYLDMYLENHMPRLNVGISVQADSNAHMTTDGFSTAFLQRVAEKSDSVLQVFQIRNDSRSGGTVGPMLSSAMGMRAIDAGLPQLSMHSIRATTGSLDPGLGVKLFTGFFDHFEEVDAEFV